ncbi:MAG: hypothetical protein ACM3KH_00415, partial [Thiobacillus sp.]
LQKSDWRQQLMEAEEARKLIVEKEPRRHSFGMFIAGAISIAAVIVFISMTIYYSSGAAQLDLSRPGYVSVRAQSSDVDDDFKSFPVSGKLSVDILNDFKSEYDKQSQKVKKVDAFGSDPLSPTSLGIDTVETTQ